MAHANERTEVVSFRVTPEIVRRIDAIAERDSEKSGYSLTRADVVEAAVKRFLDDEERTKKRSAP